jgi:glycosyltransferase involved in cell wall biosynthesis
MGTDTPLDTEANSGAFPELKIEAFSQSRFRLATEVIRLALTRPIELLLVGHVNYAPLASMLKQIQPLMRYGVILYGIDAWQQLKGVRRRAVLHADFLISISEYTKQKAIESNGLDASRIHLLPNALERTADQLVSEPAEYRDTGSNCLLSVCRLEKSEQYKGVDKVIEALPDVAKTVRNVNYIVVGSGTDLERHKQLAHELGVQDRVHFMGFVSDEALEAAYRNCDLFVMPSAGEGFGFVFLEAMKYSKPIIAANSGGAPEVIQDGITGQLVEYGNRQELAEVIINFCCDPARREQMGKAGYQRLQDNFTFHHFQEKFSAILRHEMRSKAPMDAVSAPAERTAQVP